MKILDLVQGSDEWKAARLRCFTASEAPIMMGASPHKSRDRLLFEKASGIVEEVGEYQERLFAKGHRLEELARPIAANIIGDDLFPVTGEAEIEGLPLLASMDGLTMAEDKGFEHKMWNRDKAQALADTGEIAPEHYWQLEHQLLVSGADSILFVISDGTEINFVSEVYTYRPERRERLIQGWHLFCSELGRYQIQEPEEKQELEVKEIEPLPPLVVSMRGAVTASNMAEFSKKAKSFIASINEDLNDDQDFADAESTVKYCKSNEKKITDLSKELLDQTADIKQVFDGLEEIRESMRAKRLKLEKLVKSRKEQIKVAEVKRVDDELEQHLKELDEHLEIVKMPRERSTFAEVISGKKSLSKMRQALNEALANAKINATILAQEAQVNIDMMREADESLVLFADAQDLAFRDADFVELSIQDRKARAEKAKAEKPASNVAEIKEDPADEPDQPAGFDSPDEVIMNALVERGASLLVASVITSAIIDGDIPFVRADLSKMRAA